MFLFRSHLVSLLVEFLDLDFSRSNVSLQLFDLVIQHEFELFKLLDFLLEVQNSNLLLFQCDISLSNFRSFQLDVLSKLLLVLHLSVVYHSSLHEITPILLFVVVKLS